MALIFYVSSLHEAPLPQGVSDKSAHWLGYTGFSVTIVRALAGGLPRRISLRTAMVAVVIAVAYGASDEFHQMFVAGRSAELADLAADALGAVAGAAACWAWGIISIRSRHEL
jgi:VanZ family protein